MRAITIPPLRMPACHPPKGPLVLPPQIGESCVFCALPIRATKWLDSSGRGNNGSLVNAVWTSKGNRRPAVYFDGTGDYVDFGSVTEIDNTLPLTIAVRVYISMGASAGTNLVVKGRFNFGGFTLYHHGVNDRLTLQTFQAGAYQSTTMSSPRPYYNAWRSIVAVIDDANKGHIYIDGVDRTFVSGTHITPTNGANYDLTFGISWNKLSDLLTGWIETVQLYTRAFTESEVRQWHEQWR